MPHISDEQLMGLLKENYEREMAKIPNRHSQQTDLCPFGRYAQYVKEGWPPELVAHATNCAYCQKCLAIEWEILKIHPTAAEINDPNHPNRMAIERHINWHNCKKCAKKKVR